MSTGAFEGLEAVLPPQEDEGYEPGGAPSLDLKAVDALVGLYLGEGWAGTFAGGWCRRFAELSDDVIARKLLELMPSAREKGFDANEFLSLFIQRWAPAVDPSELGWEFYLTDIVQALHKAGHNDFVIDGEPLPAPMDLGGLTGDPERKLHVTYRAVCSRGLPSIEHMHNCIAEVEGECGDGGKSSTASVFVFTDVVRDVGQNASGCIFHLHAFAALSRYASDCSFYCWDDVPDDRELEGLYRAGFFKTNRLFACHEDGTHERIMPSGHPAWMWDLMDPAPYLSLFNAPTFIRKQCERPIPWEDYL